MRASAALAGCAGASAPLHEARVWWLRLRFAVPAPLLRGLGAQRGVGHGLSLGLAV